MPSSGAFITSSIEVAVPPGSSQFVKSELGIQRHVSILPGLVLSLAGNLNVIHPGASLCDRYHSGGPLNFRGFSVYGIGPRAVSSTGGYELGDSIGGLVKYNALALLGFPITSLIPWENLNGSRAFLHAGVGSLGRGEYSSGMYGFFGKPRISVGSGLAFNVANTIRLEITYSLPVLFSKHDILKQFQFGFGLSIN